MLMPFWSFAQDTEGEIIYDQLIKMDFDTEKMPDHVKEFMKQFPKEQHFKKQLLFNQDASMYKAFKDPDAEAKEVATEGPEMRMRMRMERPDEETYVDLETSEITQKKDFFGRTFLIVDTVEALDWKVTGESKEINGFLCMKATAMMDTIPIEAWFCPTIPVSVGPEGMSGLPGAVLEASMRDGQLSMVAEKVEFRKVKKNEMEKPSKGKKVTREEFRQIVKEKMAEMREMRGGHGPGGGHMMMHGR